MWICIKILQSINTFILDQREREKKKKELKKLASKLAKKIKKDKKSIVFTEQEFVLTALTETTPQFTASGR